MFAVKLRAVGSRTNAFSAYTSKISALFFVNSCCPSCKVVQAHTCIHYVQPRYSQQWVAATFFYQLERFFATGTLADGNICFGVENWTGWQPVIWLVLSRIFLLYLFLIFANRSPYTLFDSVSWKANIINTRPRYVKERCLFCELLVVMQRVFASSTVQKCREGILHAAVGSVANCTGPPPHIDGLLQCAMMFCS